MILNNKFLILAGGYGTRLSEVIGGLPKVLAPVNDKPFLSYQMDNWIFQGITDFTFLLHYKSDLIIEFLQEYKKNISKEISYTFIIEDNPLGTGGAILHAMNVANIEKCIIINADTWIESGYKKLFSATAPSMLVANVEDASRFGRVSLDVDNFVISFNEKDGLKTPGIINAGLFLLTKHQLQQAKEATFSLESEILQPLAKAKRLQAIISDKSFFDIGIPEDLYLFREYILTKHKYFTL